MEVQTDIFTGGRGTRPAILPTNIHKEHQMEYHAMNVRLLSFHRPRKFDYTSTAIDELKYFIIC